MLPNSWNEIMIVLLYFTAARGDPQVVMVKDGDDATLPCEHLLDSQVSCGLTWLFSNDSNTYELITSGRIGSGFTSRARRLSLTANCSLVIKGVAAQDAGPYFCRMYQGGREKDSVIYLYVVTLTVKSISEDGRMASCIVHSPGRCQHQVMWLLAGTRVNSQHSHVKTSRPSKCNTTASFTSSYSIYSTKELLQCQVEYSSTKLVLDLPSTGDRQQERSLPKTDNTNTESTGEPPQHNSDKGKWWLFVVVAVALLALLVSLFVVAMLIRRRRNKVSKTDTGLRPAGTYQNGANADVSYASISYVQKNRTATVSNTEGETEGDAVTYVTVKTSFTMDGPSEDSSVVYASVSQSVVNEGRDQLSFRLRCHDLQ
ncbi:uncharacterized protein LOC129172622 isoform X3 [Dunckerocampus dactyliophorus]|uniref:uncharacterized protein LOC129172622 isoform X3 n=1 Tax=Dunckerocampus dactyliophorus TaxID=161453 RepID=UPI002404D205|nr:uncharacterized protein LOC129172622 isoform X3 [Dunckerocampus dactyliophorus]